jgi:hypothetical protein
MSDPIDTLSIPQSIKVVLICAALYWSSYWINQILFSALHFSWAATWIYLPTGMRLVLVLTCSIWGAIGIALASTILGLEVHENLGIYIIMTTAMISGFAPYLARIIGIRCLGIPDTLEALKWRDLLKLSFICSILNTLLHQFWYLWVDLAGEDWSEQTWAMFTGDFLGSMLILYFLKWLKRRFKPNSN